MAPLVAQRARHSCAWHSQHHRCVGCGTQGRPGRSDRRFALRERSEDRRRGTRRIGAATAIEWRMPRSRLRGAVTSEVRAGSAGAPAQVLGEVHRHVTGTAITSAGGSDGSRAQHAAGDAERSEAASAARSAREKDGAAATPLTGRETGRAAGMTTRPAMRSSQAARMTGMPSCLALSTRFSVMPLPGNAMTPLGRRFRSSSLRRNGAARPGRSQSGLQTI